MRVLALVLLAGCVRDPSAAVLPWRAGTPMYLTQDCGEGDHAGAGRLAYDWASSAGAFPVVAARAGRITHVEIASTHGCGDESCIDDANVVVVDHGDGTQATYLHLAGYSLAPGIACGAQVRQGQALATAGSTGWSTDVHLHFQVSAVHPNAATCECGADGLACAAGTVPWRSFWATPKYPTLPVAFVEWPDAAGCSDRHLAMPASQSGG